MTAVVVRPLMPDDAVAARRVLAECFGGTPYRARMDEILESALRFEDPEFLCLLAGPDEHAGITGIVLFGTVAGASAISKVHAVASLDPRAMLALLAAVRDACERSGERMVICEMPNDEPFDAGAIALVASGYREEGRIDDFHRDGVALRLLVWRPDGGGDVAC